MLEDQNAEAALARMRELQHSIQRQFAELCALTRSRSRRWGKINNRTSSCNHPQPPLFFPCIVA